jgi:hypothetical protein
VPKAKQTRPYCTQQSEAFKTFFVSNDGCQTVYWKMQNVIQ